MTIDQKKNFQEFLRDLGHSNPWTLRNYVDWVHRAETKLKVSFSLSDLISETEISAIIQQLRSLPAYNRNNLAHGTKTALGRYRLMLLRDRNVVSEIVEELAESGESFSTSILSEVESRLGQGIFRKRTIEFWDSKCAVTGCQQVELLIASHVKPWSMSNSQERLNGENGILLLPSLDKLFDRGLISFGSNGNIIISPKITSKTKRLFNLQEDMRLQKTSPTLKNFLKIHRTMWDLDQ